MINPSYYFSLSEEPINATRGIRNSRIVKVLELMLYGCPIKLEDYYYELVETDQGGFCPIVIINSENRLIQGMPDTTLKDFSEMVAAMPDKEYNTWVKMHESSMQMWDNISKNKKD